MRDVQNVLVKGVNEAGTCIYSSPSCGDAIRVAGNHATCEGVSRRACASLLWLQDGHRGYQGNDVCEKTVVSDQHA